MANQGERSAKVEGHMIVRRNKEKRRDRSAEWLQSIQKGMKRSGPMMPLIQNVLCLVLMGPWTCSNQLDEANDSSVETSRKRKHAEMLAEDEKKRKSEEKRRLRRLMTVTPHIRNPICASLSCPSPLHSWWGPKQTRVV